MKPFFKYLIVITLPQSFHAFNSIMFVCSTIVSQIFILKIIIINVKHLLLINFLVFIYHYHLKISEICLHLIGVKTMRNDHPG